MARSKDNDARIVKQLASGRRVRYVYSVPFIVAEARTNMTPPNHILADAIKNTTVDKAVFAAPCAGKVVRVWANAKAFVDMAVGGTVGLVFKKAVIADTDVSLNSSMAIGTATVPTAETAIDGTLSTTAGALDLIDGQLVYAEVVVSNHTVDVGSDSMVFNVEFVPMDASYASDV